MKILRKANSKILVLLITLLTILSLLTGLNVSRSPKAYADGTTYLATEVEAINFLQGTSRVIFTFRLTESDYDDCGEVQGDFSNNESVRSYLTSLGYWKNFSSMNSKGVEFDQLFAYWNGGHGASTIGTRGANAVAHRSSLAKLEYGFLIYFPAGTSFPSLTYVKANCEGVPVAYKTTSDVAFCYDGKSFVKIDYKIATTRMAALSEIKSLDTSMYREAERQQIATLARQTEAALDISVTLLEVQSAMDGFREALSGFRTIEYYQQLDDKKEQAKKELSGFFGDMPQSAYGAAEWALLSLMKNEVETLIDGAADMESVDEIAAGIRYKADEVLTEEEKPAFAQYVAATVKSVQASFVAALYRETEAAQGATLVEECKKELEKATTYGEAEAIELFYLTKIEGLKTAAEWEAEEEANKQDSPPRPEQTPPEQSSEKETENSSGCGSLVGGSVMSLGLVFAFMLVAILKNKKRMEI